jgi:hypothetical protein
VVALLEAGGSVEDVAAAASEAAEHALRKCAHEPGFSVAFWLLTQLPLAARHKDFAAHLRRLGLKVGQDPGLLEIVGAFSEAVQAQIRKGGNRTDLGEMAKRSAVESLTAMAGRSLPRLFGTSPADVQSALAKLANTEHFSDLARDFYSRLTRRHLEYYLSRELANHVGAGGRFGSISEHTEFNRDLDRHCRETSRILKEYARDWYWNAQSAGEITREKADRFAGYAFKKIRDELRKRRDADG